MGSMPLSLFASGSPHCRALLPRRHQLDETSWVDLFPAAVGGADALFGELERRMVWQRGRRLMYGTWYDEPRLSAADARPGTSIPAIIDEIRSELSEHYRRTFEGLFCNFYRSGADSVAWHADRIGRTEIDPLVAIVSLGGPRTFAMRPFGGGVARRWELHSGDILVMGGATQHFWEHGIPKCRHSAPRMSVTMRAGGEPWGQRAGGEPWGQRAGGELER